MIMIIMKLLKLVVMVKLKKNISVKNATLKVRKGVMVRLEFARIVDVISLKMMITLKSKDQILWEENQKSYFVKNVTKNI